MLKGLLRILSPDEAAEDMASARRDRLSWPRFEYRHLADNESVALDLLDLFDRGPAWLHRRVEAVDFYDDISVAHHVSMDFTVPIRAPSLPEHGCNEERVRILPLTMLAKAPLSGFDLRDESGGSVPVLTTEQNGALALGMLRAWARSIVAADLHPDLDKLLQGVVYASHDHGEALVRILEEGPLGPAEAQRRALAEEADGAFVALVDDLAAHFILFIAIIAEPGDRRIIKMRYDASYTLGWQTSPLRRAMERIGWIAPSARFELVAPIPAESQHFEVAKPADVYIVRVRTEREPGGARAQVGGRAPHVHVHVGDLADGETVAAVVDLRPERRGWLRAATFAALGVTLLLWFFAISLNLLQPWSVESMTSTAPRRDLAPILVAVAALAASLLIRPREHALATALLSLVRWVAAAPPVAAFAFAGLLALRPPLMDRPVVWWTLVLCSGVATAFLVAGLIAAQAEEDVTGQV